MRSSLPTRLVLRRLGQDPGSDPSTDPSTDPSVVTDPNLTGGSDPNAGSSGSTDWVSSVGGWVSDIVKGFSTGNNSSSGTPASAAPQTAPTTANAAVPAASGSSGVSTTTLALIGGGVAVTGLVVYLAAKGGSRSRRR
jgi:hypothetical protein